MKIKRFLEGIKIIIKFIFAFRFMEFLEMVSKEDTEEGKTAKYTIYIVNFIMANLGILIMFVSAYLWYMVTLPSCANVLTLTDRFGNKITPDNISKMNVRCLMNCLPSISVNITPI